MNTGTLIGKEGVHKFTSHYFPKDIRRVYPLSGNRLLVLTWDGQHHEFSDISERDFNIAMRHDPNGEIRVATKEEFLAQVKEGLELRFAAIFRIQLAAHDMGWKKVFEHIFPVYLELEYRYAGIALCMGFPVSLERCYEEYRAVYENKAHEIYLDWEKTHM